MENPKYGVKKPRFSPKQKIIGAGLGLVTLGATIFGVRKYNERQTPIPTKTDYDPQNEIGI